MSTITRTVTCITCDMCDNEIPQNAIHITLSPESDYDGGIRFTVGESNWTFPELDFCSVVCVSNFFSNRICGR